MPGKFLKSITTEVNLSEVTDLLMADKGMEGELTLSATDWI